MIAKPEVADVLDAHWPQVEQSATINSWQLRTLGAVKRCRTAALGSHVDGCTSCGHLRISYNSCRNRHCPKCQGKERDKWIQARETELLPVPYFHVVFTLPDTLNHLFCFVNPPPGTMQCRCGCNVIVCPQVCSMAIIPVCAPSHFVSCPKQLIVSHTLLNKMLYMVAG